MAIRYKKLTNTADSTVQFDHHKGGRINCAVQRGAGCTYTTVTFQYSLDSGTTWNDITDGTTLMTFNASDEIKSLVLTACDIRVVMVGITGGTLSVVIDPA